MGMRGKSLLLGAALVVAGCAEAAPGSSGGESQAPEVGTRVEGSVKLVDDGGGTCLAVRYKQDGAVVEVPLALPAGYSVSNAVMANPDSPGSDWDGPALKDEQGNLLGFIDTGVIVAGTVVEAADARVASASSACGWEGRVLAPDAPYGVSVDPDGLSLVTRICAGIDPTSGLETDPVQPLDTSSCVAVTQEPWD